MCIRDREKGGLASNLTDYELQILNQSQSSQTNQQNIDLTKAQVPQQSKQPIQQNNSQKLVEQKKEPVKQFTLENIQEMEKKGYNKSKYTLDRQSQWVWEYEPVENVSQTNQIKVLVISWNLKGSCPKQSLQELVRTKIVKHNLIVIGTQECCRSIAMSFLCKNKTEWEHQLQTAVGIEYSMIQSHTMNAMHICVFAHDSIVDDIYKISVDQKASGFLGFMENKGCVSISMSIGNKSFLFLNCHLASGQFAVKKRNQNYQQIIEGINLPLKYHNSKISLLERFDYIFFFGDLNYRINNDKEFLAIQQIANQDILPLLKNDQLLLQNTQEKTFSSFKEGFPEFLPTYKMKSSEKGYESKRMPGWTDRILFKEKYPESIKLMNYEAGIDVYGSDHRPVFGQFLCMTVVKSDHKYNQPIYEKKKRTGGFFCCC
eukprot:TRINITY_DN8617_c0_g2_i2.p1 TRINITY_DN8617_c0_g2~~TRINITY_DN8617_c0_g2_i2.p1  ORF type:complete len:430 (+),score=59.60 TRINITY_DN8617_c0_g2_i2:149-1438(+)